MKKIKAWVKTAWVAVDGHKRNIALLFVNSYAAILASWNIGPEGPHKWIYSVCATTGYILSAIGIGHSMTKNQGGGQ
jgi:hypothetical protein